MKTPGIQIFTCVCSYNDWEILYFPNLIFEKSLFFILISQLSSGILVKVQ